MEVVELIRRAETEGYFSWKPTAFRMLFFRQNPDKWGIDNVEIMLFKHKAHGLYTLPGGRVDTNELPSKGMNIRRATYLDLIKFALTTTLPRELNEEIGLRDNFIPEALEKRRIAYVGKSEWRRDDQEVREDIALSYYCPLGFSPNISITPESELSDFEWKSIHLAIENETIFPNVRMLIDQFQVELQEPDRSVTLTNEM